ncbi:putative gag/pol polyprotein [Puccinia sorghi]|uniref:Putative gag/pol polyprotein n=1 Tax=Puccinia sorghi TaxID=27349 RepID=A0A0L6VII2_9BASI|nr:putative gag/pol polyprotein [Puccinia sorghi]
MLLLYSIHKNLKVKQFDVQGDFLHAPLSEDVFIKTPKGVNQKTPYLKLKKSLYGLKQSPKNWYKTLTEWLNSIGFQESSSDPCLYLCNNDVSRIFFHVDDLILVGPGKNLEKQFKERFSNSSCHNPNTILGMRFEREDKKIKFSLPNHIQHGLEELGLKNFKTLITPLIPNLKLPDIIFSVSSLARYSVKPGIIHWHEFKKVCQYLRGAADLKLTLNIKEPNQLLQIYSDASWGDDPKDRTSQSGYICFLFGTLISWNSSKQRSITYSSTEAELNPLVDAFYEGLWLKAVLAEVWNIQIDSANHLIDDPNLQERLMMSDEEFNKKFSNLHLIDNKGLKDKIKKFGSNPRTRHIDLKTKGIRKEVKSKNI